MLDGRSNDDLCEVFYEVLNNNTVCLLIPCSANITTLKKNIKDENPNKLNHVDVADIAIYNSKQQFHDGSKASRQNSPEPDQSPLCKVVCTKSVVCCVNCFLHIWRICLASGAAAWLARQGHRCRER